MPTYEYLCSACQHEWEAEQSMKDEPLRDCPKCNGATAKRQISVGAGFVRGGGAAAPRGAASDPAQQAFHDRFEKVSGIKMGEKS